MNGLLLEFMKDKQSYINLNYSILNKKFIIRLDNDFFKNIKGIVTGGNIVSEVTCDKAVDDSFHFNVHSVGNVTTPCDICLDDVELRIDIKDDVLVKLGGCDFDDGETVMVNKLQPFIDMTDIVYQFIIVSLPIKHVHKPGMCNDVMMKQFLIHQVDRSDDEQTDIDARPTSNEHEDVCDHRWDELKKVFNK